MDDIRVPIYLVTGFLESGKTTFLDFTLQQEYFAIDGKTLLILCEEGEEEYDMDKLKLTNTVVEVIEDEEDLTPQRLAAMDIIHQPERVVIEYNGMWLVSKFEQMELPEGWGIEQEITCVDATTYQVYMANMKSLFMDMIRNTDMVVFNRCKEGDPLPAYRRGIKVANQSAEVIFENEEGEDSSFEIFGDIAEFTEPGTATIYYYKYPKSITADTEDDYIFELSGDVLEIMPYGVAADILKSDVSNGYGQIYNQRYEQMLQRLDPRYSTGFIYIDQGVMI